MKPALKLINPSEKQKKFADNVISSETNELIEAESCTANLHHLKLPLQNQNIFDLLHLVDDLEQTPLDDVLKKAKDEGEKFLQWKNSKDRLKRIRFFQKLNNQLKHIKCPIEFSATNSLEVNIKKRLKENAQFEIWECNEDYTPKFPLYRLPFSKIIEADKLLINEQLRSDYCLHIEAEKQENDLIFKVSVNNLLQEDVEAFLKQPVSDQPISLISTLSGIYGLINNLLKEYLAMYQKNWHQCICSYKNEFLIYGKTFASIILLFTVSFSVLIKMHAMTNFQNTSENNQQAAKAFYLTEQSKSFEQGEKSKNLLRPPFQPIDFPSATKKKENETKMESQETKRKIKEYEKETRWCNRDLGCANNKNQSTLAFDNAPSHHVFAG